eukprot:scaffold29718_cov109-Isochrysis_galbana.AAC.3
MRGSPGHCTCATEKHSAKRPHAVCRMPFEHSGKAMGVLMGSELDSENYRTPTSRCRHAHAARALLALAQWRHSRQRVQPSPRTGVGRPEPYDLRPATSILVRESSSQKMSLC